MNSVPQSPLLPGFRHPVTESQYTFRQILRAFSHPGRVIPLEVELSVPGPLHRVTGAICLTLLDHETPLWVNPKNISALEDWLRFHCGCPIVDVPSDATFALLLDGSEEFDLNPFPPGEEEFPEKSATLIIQVKDFQTGTGRTFRGPGVRTTERLRVEGLSEAFWGEWWKNHKRYPLGIDVLLSSSKAIVGLPRTVEVGEE